MEILLSDLHGMLPSVLGILRGMLTPVLGIVLFLGILKWAYGKKSEQGYEEAANLVFADDHDMEPGHLPRSR